MRPLVGIFAHPDDEAFGPSGALATFTKEREVYLICVTSGDAGQNATGKHTELGIIRRAELRKSASILGIKDVFFLGYKDGSLCNSLYQQIAKRIEKILKEIRPDTLLTFEQKGVSGHIDHIAVSMITSFIFGRNDFLKTLLYYCELTDFVQELGDYFIYMPPGYKKSETDLEIDVSGVWETKLASIHAHVSQKDDALWVTNVLAKFPQKEYFLKTEK